jgi:hypothetical protein
VTALPLSYGEHLSLDYQGAQLSQERFVADQEK